MSTQRYAVIGDPIAHSLSPVIHSAFAVQHGIAIDYQAIPVAAGRLPEALDQFVAQGGHGVNVTVPHKTAAFEFAQQRTVFAQRAVAVNTLSWQDGQWYGDNTDGRGLINDLTRRHHITLADCTVMLLGAGGAASGIAPALLDAGIRRLIIANRSAERAHQLGQRLGLPAKVCTGGWELIATELAHTDVLIQATSALQLNPTFNLPLPTQLPNRSVVAVDINYGKAAAPFMDWAMKANALACYDGLGMLVEQAAVSFAVWHGVQPETATIYDDLRRRLGRSSRRVRVMPSQSSLR